MTVSIKELFEQGVQKMLAEHATSESGKVGTLRVGNTGLLTGDGRIVGKCARLSYLRMKGVTVEEADESRELMFAGGRGNEDLWIDVLKRSWDGIILREEETPITWTTSGGVQVTGRPDIVLCRPDPGGRGDHIPVKGIELKLVSSLWTARDVGFELKPKTQHLMQAAHYSWKLNVPFELWYTNRADFAVIGWAVKLFPKKGEPLSERCEYGLYETWLERNPDTGRMQRKQKAVKEEVWQSLPEGKRACEVKKVLPFVQGYELSWNEKGQLMYRAILDDDSAGPKGRAGKWQYTIITKQSIEAYYEQVSSVESTGILPERPAQLDADGQKASFNACDYCVLQKTCDSAESKGLGGWLSAVTKQKG